MAQTVSLKPITRENWKEIARLKVAPGQENFVASNAYSIAEALYESEGALFPHGIYADDTPVGFIMYGYDDFNGYCLWFVEQLMIDKAHQRKGYGRQGLHIVIDRLKAMPDVDGLTISYVPENTVAQKLYADMGFVDEGLTIDGETLVVMRFN